MKNRNGLILLGLCMITQLAMGMQQERPAASMEMLPADLKSYTAQFLASGPSMELLARDVRSWALVNKSFYKAIQDQNTMLAILKSLPYTAQAVDLGEKLKTMKVMKNEQIVAWLEDQKKKLILLNGIELHKAVKSQNEPAVTQLLKDRNVNLNFQSKFRCSALIYAAMNQDKAVVAALLAAGANVTIVDNGNQNALMCAVHKCSSLDDDTELIQMLITAGADVNYVSGITPFPNVLTPLMKAAQKGLKNVIRILLQAGANPELKDTLNNYTAIDHARASTIISPEEKEIVIQMINDAIKGRKAAAKARVTP